MTDKESVIEGLEHCKKSHCYRCPYVCDGLCGANCTADLASDVLDLLKEQKEERPRWIPVEEKLPDKEGRYLVCDGGDVLEAQFYLTGQLRRPEWSTTDCYESEDLDHVTHWMPLPCPPEGDKV